MVEDIEGRFEFEYFIFGDTVDRIVVYVKWFRFGRWEIGGCLTFKWSLDLLGRLFLTFLHVIISWNI